MERERQQQGKGGNPGVARNGMTALEIARSGYAILARVCSIGTWEGADQQAWETLAIEAIKAINKAVDSEETLTYSTFARTIYSAAYKGEILNEQPFPVRIAWEALGRHWVSCVSAETPILDFASMESEAANWIMKKCAEAIPQTNGVKKPEPVIVTEAKSTPMPAIMPNAASQAATVVTPERFAEQMFERPAPNENSNRAICPVKNPGDSDSNGAAEGFRNLIAAQIVKHRQKIASLERLASLIDPDCDEALWELFAPLVK